MEFKVQGIHHISAIAGHAQENLDFYAGILGLRLIKQTVNFDDANTYHTYFGNPTASVGSGITFFPWLNAREGTLGDGQVSVTIYAIPVGSLSFWEDRLTSFNIPYYRIEKFGQTYLHVIDPHNLHFELVESDFGPMNPHAFNGVTPAVAIKGFYGAILNSAATAETIDFMINTLGLESIDANREYVRFKAESELGRFIDVRKTSIGKGKMGIGVVHHIAFAVALDELADWHTYLEEEGYFPTPIKNRKYFQSIYFTEPGGNIIEIASKDPGIFIDETMETLGTSLQLPDYFEHLRPRLLEKLFPLDIYPIRQLKKYHYTNHAEYLAYKQHVDMLERINELAKISRERSLSKAEETERETLRQQYAKLITSGLKNMVEGIKIVDIDGKEEKFVKKQFLRIRQK